MNLEIFLREHGINAPRHAHPLTNDATMVLAHADLERFLDATGHVPRIVDVPKSQRASTP